MKLLLSGNTKTLDSLLKKCPAFGHYIGALSQPKHLMLYPQLTMAADNLAYSGFNAGKYINMVAKLSFYNLEWISVPDKVANAKETLNLFYHWLPILISYKKPLAFVAQDGCEDTNIPWEYVKCLFIGGSTKFKYSKTAIDIINEAKNLKKSIHVGRVNSVERINYFYEIGIDSFDGTGYSHYSYKIVDFLNFITSQRLKDENHCIRPPEKGG